MSGLMMGQLTAASLVSGKNCPPDKSSGSVEKCSLVVNGNANHQASRPSPRPQPGDGAAVNRQGPAPGGKTWP